MTHPVDILLVVVILLNFLVLGTPSLRMTIRGAALQGAVLAVLPLLVHRGFGWRVAAIAIATMAIKGLLIPGLLEKAMRDIHIRHEVEPYVGFVPSLFLCAVGTGLAILFAGNLPLAPEHVGTLIVPASLATLLSGFLVLTTRRKAISQVVGYLILENGIFIFGQLLIEAMPFLVEAGVLLDLFVGIFIMGIVINHIRQEFSSLDTDLLSELKD
ncbi:MAG: hydrogenase [Holophagales bacterium]|nr:hydrogenase [Holophagales bacterium]